MIIVLSTAYFSVVEHAWWRHSRMGTLLLHCLQVSGFQRLRGDFHGRCKQTFEREGLRRWFALMHLQVSSRFSAQVVPGEDGAEVVAHCGTTKQASFCITLCSWISSVDPFQLLLYGSPLVREVPVLCRSHLSKTFLGSKSCCCLDMRKILLHQNKNGESWGLKMSRQTMTSMIVNRTLNQMPNMCR